MLWSGKFFCRLSFSPSILPLLHQIYSLLNLRGITRDETIYPDPETFNPARWLSPAFPTTYREPLTHYPNLNGYSQFGFGRRTCQGVPIVDQDLFLAMGGLAWAFDIRKKRDPVTGEEVKVHWNDYTPLLIAKPAKFDFEAVPRGGEERRAEILGRARAMKGDGDEEEELVLGEDGCLRIEVRIQESAVGECEGAGECEESDHDVLVNVRDSSSEPSEDGGAVGGSETSESDHDVLIDVRESSSEPSEMEA